jgi:beta-phosphoglucomutase
MGASHMAWIQQQPAMSLPVLKGVVFDLDGVIVDSHPAHRFAWKEFLRILGKEVTDCQLDFVMDGRKREDILIHFLGPLSEAQLEHYGKMKNALFWQAAYDMSPIPGAFEFIGCLYRAGITLAVATSASTGRSHSILTRTGLLSCFGAVVTGDEVRKGKPDPAIYRLACQRINCSPNAAVAIEDAASGIRAAKDAGMKCVGVAGHNSGDHLIAAGADCILEDFVNVSLSEFHTLVGMQAFSRNDEHENQQRFSL